MTRYLALISLITSLFSFSAQATVLDAQDHQFDLGVEQRSVAWLPGEQYDILSGKLNHRVVDMEVPGNGSLPIVVARTFLQKRSKREGLFMYYMGLDIPRITYTTYGQTGYFGSQVCNDLLLLNANPNGGQKDHLRSPITFTDGQNQQFLFSTDPLEDPGNIARFPQEAEYVSSSNWYAECKNMDGINNSVNSDEFVVYSPDGLKYILGKATAIDQGNWTSVTWRVTKIYDPYDNWLEFHYENGWNRQADANRWNIDKLEKITSDDGREVQFRYGENGTADRLLTTVENTQGTPNNHKVTYAYGSGFNSLTVTQNDTLTYTYDYESDFSGDPTVRLSKITYPYGGTVQYIYDGNHRTTSDYSRYNLGTYKPLIERQVSDGGIYTFRFQQVNGATFWRVVNTPDGSISYQYRKSNRNPIFHDINKRPYVHDGRLLRKNEFGRTIAIGEEDTIPLRRTSYAYQENEAVTTSFHVNDPQGNPYPLQKYGTTQISRKFVTVENFNENETNSLNRREYQQYFYDLDDYGKPRKIRERAPKSTDRHRYRIISYNNNAAGEFGNRWIRSKVQSVATRKSVNGANEDLQTYSHNTYGDVKWHSDNGIINETLYHASGSSAGEVHYLKDGLGNLGIM